MTGGQARRPDQPDIPDAAVEVWCDHFWAWRLQGGFALGIRQCMSCNAIDWDVMRQEADAYAAAELERWILIFRKVRESPKVSKFPSIRIAVADLAAEMESRARELRGGPDSDTGGGT